MFCQGSFGIVARPRCVLGEVATVKGALRLLLTLCCVYLGCALPGLASQVPKRPVVEIKSDARLEAAAAAIDEGRYSDALNKLASTESGVPLSERDADWAAYLKSRALAANGNPEEAEKNIRERQRAYPNAYNWASLVSILMSCGRQDEAAKAILAIAHGEFVLVNRLRHGVIENILVSLESGQSGLRDELVTKLIEGRYTGPASQHIPDTIRLRYINLLLRQNRVESAVRETLSVESPTVLSILLTDKSFSPIWKYPAIRALLSPGALAARVERGIQARLEQPILLSSDWLELMRSLRVIGKADEAVRLGLNALEQARNDKRAAGPALRLEIANAYADMGELWAARRTARELQKEQSTLPVALRVSIAHVLEITGDDEGAILMLNTLDGVGSLASAQKVLACAAHDLDRKERRDAAIVQLESMADVAAVELMDAYVCVGQGDKAKQVLVAMLARPELRSTAILTAQLYADPSRAGTDLADLRYRMRALAASHEVQEAIKAYARTLGLPFTNVNSR